MKHTEKEVMEIVKAYKASYPDLDDEIKQFQFNEQFDVEGLKAWIVTGEYILFDEPRAFFYVISDKTGKVEYTFNEHGTRDPHLIEYTKEELEEWEKLNEEDEEEPEQVSHNKAINK